MEAITLTDEQMHSLKKHELNALIELDRICKKHNLRYFMMYGTLIGSIRHHGFIPWDDDIDVCMPRADYLKLRKISKIELDKKFFYQSNETDPKYFYLFDKIRVQGTTFRETYLDTYNVNHGVYIDIFPVDNCDLNSLRGKIQYAEYRVLRVILNCKYYNSDARHGKKRKQAKAISFLFRPLSNALLYRKAEKVAQRLNDQETESKCVFCSAYGKRDVFPKAYYMNLRKGDFEQYQFNIPVQYDAMLTQLYGNYMMPPEKEKRVSIHEITELKV